MDFRLIDHGSPEYADARTLRNNLLRLPLGLSIDDQDQDAERDDLHFGIFDGATLIACVVLSDQGDGRVRLRQMAVDTGHQRQGIGRLLVAQVEADMRVRQFKTIIVHAREPVVPFYQQLGYKVIGEGFVEVTIPHALMEKQI